MTVELQHQQPWELRPVLTSVDNTIITTSESKHDWTMAGMCCSNVVQQPYPVSQVCHRFTLPPHGFPPAHYTTIGSCLPSFITD